MSKAITVRLTTVLAKWLEAMAAESGVSKAQILRAQLEKARAEKEPAFMSLAGKVSGSKNLSSRNGYSIE